MKNISWKKVLPHLIAVGIFLIVAVLYCRPALEGKVMQQGDLTQWKGMSKDQQNYYDKNGQYPLWTNGMFGGMPGYLIAGKSNNYFPAYFVRVITLNLPEPLNFFFLACICFYFLGCVLGARPWISMIGALLYAYATFNPIIIRVGHVTQMYCIALMPGVIASLQLLIKKKYWWGAGLTAFFTSAVIAYSHYQIIYYTLIIALFMGGAFAIACIREKEYKHLFIVAIIAIFTGCIGAATNAVGILPTEEYSKETIRGGSSIANTGDSKTATGTGGLNEDYAFSYSFYMSEPFVMIVPRMFGGSSDRVEVKQEQSKAVQALQSMPQELGQQLAGGLQYYWGGINGVGTAGPPYVGAIVCFLAILGFVIVDKKYKWWILSCCVIAIVMSWGGYFKDINRLFLEYLPMYNKFRAPSMIIVIPTLLFGIMAILALEKILGNTNVKDNAALLLPYKKAMIITAGIFVLLIMLYLSFDYQSDLDKQILGQVSSLQEDIKAPVKQFINALGEDRKDLFIGDILRSLFFIAVAAGALWLYLKNKLKPGVVIAVIGVFAFIDVMAIDVKYMNSTDFVSKDDYDATFVPSDADNQIMQDKSFYRVLDLKQGISGAFNSGAISSYFHHTIGGYNPAKLSIYQDLIDSQLYKFPNCLPVINMLNTKYIIGQDGKAQLNPMALGNAWFVKNVQFVNDPKQVMKALDNFNPKDTAIAEKSFNTVLKNITNTDSSATISLISNRNDTVDYHSKSATEQIAVFSEVYYDKGWNVYVDGKKGEIAEVNYVLRGMMVPAGEHNIQFRFEPATHALGWTVTSITSWVMLLILIAAIFFETRKKIQLLT